MIKTLPKLILLTVVFCFSTFLCKAQLGYNFSQVDIGFATGFNQVYDEILPQKTTQSVHFNLTFNLYPLVFDKRVYCKRIYDNTLRKYL